MSSETKPKEFQKVERKRRYVAPALQELGNVQELTRSLPSGPNIDGAGRRS